ncbi:type I-C CRISPR-associated endonuclease Cas1c [Pelagicoccus sp. SDUM812003]|uniref:type I-C CRISPR-associated endonuclease Cas1c n=1 Tax=Pelagicoccus sp. SDUM812003 TaxID=3041267 RepID=UPI00280FA97F|nr:type I-C CRISPR-associated endonuclease Cas1c [Pelagicoccus sp. SDUM812003]MDQ8201751.1 type I-C CRISPR-associated endonuclease Cas1c [Pelagicoccus sp. SDUM812003]
MAQVIKNTLYLMTQGLYLHRDHLSLRIKENKETRLSVPIHNLESVCIFGHSSVSPSAMRLCWQNNVSISFLSENGHFEARVEGIPNSSVVLKRHQFKKSSSPEHALAIAQNVVAGKIQNTRWLLRRSAREQTNTESRSLGDAADAMAHLLRETQCAESLDALRGTEGRAAAIAFDVWPLHLKPNVRERFHMKGRNRRPPRDPVNALLSYAYALLRHDCIAALSAVGLDPFLGFLHADRPARESLALDLMEEFRPWAERMIITILNRGEISKSDLVEREGGSWEISSKGRKQVVQSWQTRKKQETKHTLLKQKVRFAQLPLIQARLMAKTIREEVHTYTPYLYT